MKRAVLIVAIALLAVVHIGLFVKDFRPAGAMHGSNNELMTGIDFSMRRNEAACVLKGVNPYDVWTKKVILRPYYPFLEKPGTGFSEPINAYTPWEYVAAFPYASMEKQTAWHIHLAVMWLAFLTLLLIAARVGGLPAVFAVLLFVIPINIDFNVGNYPTIITAAIAAMMVALDRGNRIIPAVLWSIAMFKPQMSVLIAIPLLFRRQWMVGMVAAGLCLGLSFVPAYCCGCSVIDLILQAPAASAHGFVGCALMPEPVLNLLKPIASANVWMVLAMVIGVLVCTLMTWRLRASKSWLVLSLPSIICSASWTYVLQYSYVSTVVFAMIVTVDIIRTPTVGRFVVGIPAVLLWARFARGVEIVAGKFVPVLSPIAGVVCQLSATVAFLLSVVYLWRYTDSLVAMTRERK